MYSLGFGSVRSNYYVRDLPQALSAMLITVKYVNYIIILTLLHTFET